MTIKDFRAQLARTAVGPGASWQRADFHVHMPGSSDYEYKSGDAVERLGEALREGHYSFAVILKHQEFPSRLELEALQRHCPHTTLIPGAEINVIVDALFKKIGKDYFFHCIVAVDPDSTGDYGYVLRKAQEQFTYRPGEYPAGFRSSIVDVGRFFRESGALFIPAHLHQSKAPENSRSIDDLYDDDSFLSFVRDNAFDALEVRQKQTAAFFTGSETTPDGAAIPGIVCVASSDAHRHEHISDRNRSTWIRAETRSFTELTAALTFRHRVSLDPISTAHSRVVGMHVVGAFVPDVWVAFNEGFNALIGSKGSGKTALVECLRFVLATTVPPERQESVSKHVAHVLGSSGYVECLVEGSDGTQLLLTRRADSPDRITILDARGDVRTISVKEPVAFPISILGWHEIEAIADRPEARISLLDRIGDASAIRGDYEQIASHVARARDQLPLLQRLIRKLDASLRELWDLRRKRASLTRLEEGDLLSLQQEYEWYLSAEQKIESLKREAQARVERVPDAVKSQMLLGVAVPVASERREALASALANVEVALTANADAEDTATAGLSAALASVTAAATDAAATLAASFTTFRDDVYTPRVNALPVEDREVLTKQIQVLEDTKRLPRVEKECSDLLGEVKVSARLLEAASNAIIEIRNQVVQKREALVTALNLELPSVRLAFLRSANQSARTRFQKRYGAEESSLVGYVQSFGAHEPYENFRALFAKLEGISTEEDQWSVNGVLFDVKFVDLLDVMDEDDVEIRLDVGKGGLVPIQNLSAGQRCVAVFPLLLRNSRGPLVIDQPEDNLDNRYIADVIGPDLLARKQKQQFLVTSHNANLVVLTDSDLIVHVDSDGAQSSFPAAGFLSCATSAVRGAVLDVLDGGEVALAARQRKYGTGAGVT